TSCAVIQTSMGVWAAWSTRVEADCGYGRDWIRSVRFWHHDWIGLTNRPYPALAGACSGPKFFTGSVVSTRALLLAMTSWTGQGALARRGWCSGTCPTRPSPV